MAVIAKDRYVDDTMLCLFIKLNYEKRFYVVVMLIMVRAGGVAASFSLLMAAWLRACAVSCVCCVLDYIPYKYEAVHRGNNMIHMYNGPVSGFAARAVSQSLFDCIYQNQK